MGPWFVTLVKSYIGSPLPEQIRHEFQDELAAKDFARAQIKKGFGVVAGRSDGAALIEGSSDLVKWVTVSPKELQDRSLPS